MLFFPPNWSILIDLFFTLQIKESGLLDQRIFSVIYIHEYRVHMIKRGKLYLRQTRNKSCFVQGYFHLNPFMDKRKKKENRAKTNIIYSFKQRRFLYNEDK